MSRPLFTNNAASALAQAITPTDTILQLTPGTGSYFPQPTIGDYFMLTLVQINNPEVSEIVECIDRVGDTLTVVRGQEGTQPQIFNLSDNVELRITAGSLNLFAIGGGGGGSASGTSVADYTATQGQTVFTLPWSYTQGIDNLAIFINGSKQVVNVNYTESTTTSFTMASGLNAGDIVQAIYNLPLAGGVIDASNVIYNEGSSGAVNSTVKAKLQESVSVMDFGADPTGTTDSSTSFSEALTAAQTQGIGVFVPDGTYKILSTANFPSQGNSVTPVNIISGSNVIYTGTVVSGNSYSVPCFGHAKTNYYNLINGSYNYIAPSYSWVDPGNPSGYLSSGFAVMGECIPTTSFRGAADAAYFGSLGVSGANFDQGGINVLSEMASGFLGNANVCEFDLNNFAADGKGLGIVIQGVGTNSLDTAVKIDRISYGTQSPTGAGGSWIPPYNVGVTILNSKTGIYINQSQVQTPDSAIGISPGPQAVPTNAAIYVDDPNSTANFVVQNNGYIAYRDSSPITAFGTNVVSGTSPQSDDQYLMSDKTVRLAGKVTATSGNTVTSGSTLFTLDSQYRPNRTLILPAFTDNGTITWIQINTSGIVTCGINLTSSFYLQLDSVSYLLNN